VIAAVSQPHSAAALQAHRYVVTARGWSCALLIAGVSAISSPALGAGSAPKDFEVLFSGDAHIQSFTYTDPGPDNWIDTLIGLESRILRYKATLIV